MFAITARRKQIACRMSGKKSSKFRSCLNACPTSGLATVRGGQRLCIFLSQLNILPKASCLLAELISLFSVSHAAIHALERRIRQVVWWAKNYARSPPSHSTFPISGKNLLRESNRALCSRKKERENRKRSKQLGSAMCA